MNCCLIDTQIAVWIVQNDPRLKETLRTKIQGMSDGVFFSQVSLFELSIKQKIGKLPQFTTSIERVYTQLLENGLQFLTIQNSHIWIYQEIPLIETHRDPFDRLILATAFVEKIPLVSADDKFEYYSDLVEIISK
jgi:PIN domain nuclease of toxin-antitoxin system